MIPQALTLKGFLSFRDEQRLEFDQDQVWLLSGPNGSGKSTVFDAILFALYAGHRAGKADLHELINKDADRALVRFEFALAGQRYRAERMAERTTDRKTGRAGYSASQQLYAWQDPDWQPIAGTQRQGDFNEWVRDHVGLSFDAFTSSALLMQGRADVLVAQDAEAARRRFEVLARIVGLEFYEGLFRQADERRKQSEKRAGELQAQLEVLDPVDPASLDELDRHGAALAAELGHAERRLDELHTLKAAAARWRELARQRADKQRDCEATATLLADVAAIERDGTRHAELHAVLPGLKRLLEMRRQVAEAEGAADALAREKEQLVTRDRQAEAVLRERRAALQSLAEEQAGDDASRQELANRRQQSALALGPLRRLVRHGELLQQARVEAGRLAQERKIAVANAKACEWATTPLAEAWTAAGAAQRDATRQAATAEARLRDFDEQARRFAQVADAQVCGYCGQTLDAEHARRERERIQRELATRRREASSTAKALSTAEDDEARCRGESQQAEQALAEARRRIADLERDGERVADRCHACSQAAQEAYAELPEPYCQQPGEPAARAKGEPNAVRGSPLARAAGSPVMDPPAAYPTARDLAQLEEDLAGLERRLNDLCQAASQRQQTHARLRVEAQQAEERRTASREALARIDGDLIQQTERLRLGRQQLDPARETLPTHWRYRLDDLDEAQLQTLAEEAARLAQADAPGRLAKLRQAQAAAEPLSRQLAELDAALAELPEVSRRDPVELDPELRAAKQEEVRLRDELNHVTAEARRLRQLQERRERLAEEHRAADRRRHLSARLAELLSRRHLQRHLLRQAEAGIVENTNRVLDRITGGQLCVRLLPEEENDDNRALQLEAYKLDVQQAFGLSFLSGSERFRVAIGLALGIGQYASRQHRAIESVIIDEGFGCLDRDNRRTMIDELDHLRGQLRCILLVSHQEEFAEAFPEGYRFRIADGMTRVERAD